MNGTQPNPIGSSLDGMLTPVRAPQTWQILAVFWIGAPHVLHLGIAQPSRSEQTSKRYGAAATASLSASVVAPASGTSSRVVVPRLGGRMLGGHILAARPPRAHPDHRDQSGASVDPESSSRHCVCRSVPGGLS
jgi:hypothetical protein